MMPGAPYFEDIEDGIDPARLTEAGERAAVAVVRSAHGQADPELRARVLGLVDSEGLEAVAELWSGAPADSLAGSLWRLFLLHAWVRRDTARAAAEFDRGRQHYPVGEAVAGLADPPGPAEVLATLDLVLSGSPEGEYADALFRAAAFARVVAAGRTGQSHDGDLSAARLLTLSQQLEHAGRLELAGHL